MKIIRMYLSLRPDPCRILLFVQDANPRKLEIPNHFGQGGLTLEGHRGFGKRERVRVLGTRSAPDPFEDECGAARHA